MEHVGSAQRPPLPDPQHLLRHEHPQMPLFHIDLALGDQRVVGIDAQRVVLGRIQFDHRTAPKAQHVVDGNDGRAQFDRDIDFNIVQGVHR